MLSLLLAAFIAAPVSLSEPQAVQATLQSCAMEGGRWVCRYAVPDIEIVPLPGNDVVADAPSVILGVRPGEAPSATEVAPTTGTIVEPSETPTPVEPERRALTLEGTVLTEREARLVARCAEAGWMSLCLPDDRRAARALRDKEAAYMAVRLDVTRLLADDRCDDAVKAALDGGYLALARETRAFCAVPATSTAD
jgi:hypothetical protein